ncbi:helix-turn-helix domain-containing protein [Pseudonocardia sp. ICBG601]|uniref:helix-turn-helix domain-containing protein n=1 Tax=Pseudonocardia sp. ICBG601 TaxID=2846759 RepID=UPI001CF69F94|nr:helix-turn-helix domain-containing protein [Pseudonocardia sp. ICBG601]
MAVLTAASPPPIPGAHTGAGWNRGTHLLAWVHTGVARVELECGRVERLAAGEGIWVPAEHGRRISTRPGAVAFPYGVPPELAPGAGSAEPVRFDVRPEWHDWLIQHYVHFIAPVTSFGYTRASLLDVVDTAAGPSTGPNGGPPLPAGPVARSVAEGLARNPALDHTAGQWADRAACSTRTLHREFLRDTGMTFAQWRTAYRLTVACELLAAGEDVSRAAVRSGFAGRNGFARAFRGRYGITPREYRERSRARDTHPSQRPPDLPRAGVLGRVLGGAAGGRPLSATQTPPHTNRVHVLSWMYRGSGYLRVDGVTHHLRRGDAIWIPAGREHQFGTHPGSIALPLGDLHPGDGHGLGGLRVEFPPSWDAYLLHRSVSARTPLRPDGHDHRTILDLFRGQLASDRARSLPMPRSDPARAVAEAVLRRAPETADIVVDRPLNDVFRRETGMTFARWCLAARMREARELLAGGATPTSVARQVGYTRLSNFSRAFTAFHSEPPREYVSRVRSIRTGPGDARGRPPR